jgi:homoserine kinase
MIKIQVPATSANIGAGFDSLGLALKLYNRVWMQEADGIHITTIDGTRVWANEQNLIYKSAKMIYDMCGKSLNGLEIRQENNIPMTRGLGSSSACIVAGLKGANTLLNNPLSQDELVNLAADLEGHPDNSTPALLGGLVTAVIDDGKVYYVKVPVSDRIKFVAFIPNFELKTEVARAALPMEVSHKDAVFNLSRSALMTASLFSGKLENLKVAVEDKLHQPYRLKFINGAQEVFELAYRSGAYGVYISGAGPTIMAMVDISDITFKERAEAEMKTNHSNWQVVMLESDELGATVEECTII